MEITQYLTVTNYTKSTTKNNKYIVIHYTANDGDTAMNNAKYFYSESRGASAHYFVDENEIVQVVSDENIGWHCGTTGSYVHSECRNNNSIGIEMCSRKYSDGSYYIKDEVVASTIELTKHLMSLYDIPVENILMHYHVTGKSCPAPFVLNTALWTNFKNKLMEEETIEEIEEEIEMRYNKLSEMPDYSQETITKMIEKGLINGSGTTFDENKLPADMDLSLDMIRIFVTNDRAGLYDYKGCE